MQPYAHGPYTRLTCPTGQCRVLIQDLGWRAGKEKHIKIGCLHLSTVGCSIGRRHIMINTLKGIDINTPTVGTPEKGQTPVLRRGRTELAAPALQRLGMLSQTKNPLTIDQ